MKWPNMQACQPQDNAKLGGLKTENRQIHIVHCIRLEYDRNEEEITRRLTKIDQLMNQMIFGFMQRGMSYREAEGELFKRLERKRFSKETEDD